MEKVAGQVLKANNVTMEGQFRLDLDQPCPAAASRPSPTAAAASAPQARVVETCPEYAVIEVACACGQKTLVKCSF